MLNGVWVCSLVGLESDCKGLKRRTLIEHREQHIDSKIESIRLSFQASIAASILLSTMGSRNRKRCWFLKPRSELLLTRPRNAREH